MKYNSKEDIKLKITNYLQCISKPENIKSIPKCVENIKELINELEGV